MSLAFSFRIFPEPGLSRLYCKVNVWHKRKDMHAYMEDTGFDGVCTGIEVHDYRKDRPGRIKPIFAEMQLCLEKINDRIVTHETGHAMFCWMRRRKITTEQLDDMEIEEKCAYALTRMKDKILDEFNKRGVHVQHDYNW